MLHVCRYTHHSHSHTRTNNKNQLLLTTTNTPQNKGAFYVLPEMSAFFGPGAEAQGFGPVPDANALSMYLIKVLWGVVWWGELRVARAVCGVLNPRYCCCRRRVSTTPP